MHDRSVLRVSETAVLGKQDMPEYTRVDLDFETFSDGNQVFVPQEKGFSEDKMPVKSAAIGSVRQQHFYAQLRRLSDHLGTTELPVFVRWRNAKNRMDKGCVGHAISADVLERPCNGRGGIVTHVLMKVR